MSRRYVVSATFEGARQGRRLTCGGERSWFWGLLMASTAIPQEASARPRGLGAVLGIITNPVGAILGAARHAGRRSAYQHRRAAASRARPATRVAAPAAAAAGAAGATAAAASTTNPSEPAATSDAAAVQPAATNPDTSTTAATQSAALSTTGSAPAGGEPAEREPLRAPAQPIAHLGTVGPLAWPTAYEDVIGFTLWPAEYAARLRGHGISDLLGTALLPSATIAAQARANSKEARADDATKAPLASSCGSVDLTSTDWPIATISSAIELDDTQRGALDQLKTSMSDAIASIKSTCRGDEANLTPVDRLRATQNTLWAVHDAALLIRAPLAKFYDSLTDEQKQKFAAPEAPASQQADPRAMSRADMARMCGSPASSEAPMRQLEQSLRPTKAQRASLATLQKKSSEMGQFLLASCLKPIAGTPAERLDAAADRLTAVIFAASNVNMALNDFTSQLNDEQKAKLHSMR